MSNNYNLFSSNNTNGKNGGGHNGETSPDKRESDLRQTRLHPLSNHLNETPGEKKPGQDQKNTPPGVPKAPPPDLPDTGRRQNDAANSLPPGNPNNPKRSGALVLNGALGAFSVSSLLSLLNIQKQTGYLRLRQNNYEGYIYVDKGEVYDAEIGRLSQGPLAVFQLFGWKQGIFSFEVGLPAPARRTIEATLPVLQVRATLWLDSMNKYSAVIPSLNHRVAIADEPRSEVVIEPHQWAVLTRIVSQPVSVAELAASLGLDLLTVTRITAELVKMGVAEVHPPE